MTLLSSLWQKLRPTRRKEQPVPQLIMWYRRNNKPEKEIPDHCLVRSYQPGDEEAWLALLQQNAELGRWDRERLDGVLADTHVQLFVECRGQIVACAGLNDKVRSEGACWEIGWVAAHPSFQGRGLGGLVTAAAMGQAMELGARPIYLLTDDFRIPALRTYLKLGFVPDESHPSYRGRWELIFDQLGENYRPFRPGFIERE